MPERPDSAEEDGDSRTAGGRALDPRNGKAGSDLLLYRRLFAQTRPYAGRIVGLLALGASNDR